jgi:hypothetical protein
MALTDLWENSRNQIEGKHVQQIIAFAGDGHLRDGGAASDDFRNFLARIPTSMLQGYAEQCLTDSFTGSGLALQDVVNEIGRRLGYKMTSGRYRGGSGQIGFDGLWTLQDGHAIVVEVKTTDAYRIDLNVIADYRKALIRECKISEEKSSILIVVGRKDTGDLEAQIRGSKHAWDVRLISLDAIMRLMMVKQDVEDPKIIKRISDILIPREFTKLDEIVEILFSTTEELKGAELSEEEEPINEAKIHKFTPVAFNEACVKRIEAALGKSFIKQSRASFISSTDRTALVCAVSKEYTRGGYTGYWFAFHPHQKEFLEAAASGYVAFGCGSEEKIVLIPVSDLVAWLDGLNTTKKEDRFYWHVQIYNDGGKLFLRRKQHADPIDLNRYKIKARSSTQSN